MTRPTYVYELLLVAAVLATAAVVGGGGWLALVAVLLTFAHAQVADRLREGVEAGDPHVECSPWLDRYWISKEIVWFAVFFELKAWPALVGCVVFALYPFWRKRFRLRHPRKTDA